MKTASYYTVKGEGLVAISRGVPRWFKGAEYRALAPGRWFNSVSREEYTRRYFAQLSELDPQQVWDDLHRLTQGREPVLLCYERPPFTDTNWCHRRMVAAWLERELGVEIPEHGGKVAAPPQQGGLF